MNAVSRSILCIVTLLSSQPAFAQTREECDEVLIKSNAVPEVLERRGADVERCLALASETVRVAYRSAYPMCKNLALAEDAPVTIEFPAGTEIKPSGEVTTWAQFALHMGKNASESGCRDGIFSALQQTLLASPEFVRGLFNRNRLEFFDVGVGEVAIHHAGNTTLMIEHTTLFGHYVETGRIDVKQPGLVTFDNVPMELDGRLSGVLRVFFLKTPVEFGIHVEGATDAILDMRNLTVTFTRIKIDKIGLTDVGNVSIPSRIEEALLAVLREQQQKMLEQASDTFTHQLRLAYQNINPFAFLFGGQ